MSMINWRTSLAVAVLAVIAALLAAGVPVDLVAAAPLIGALYAALFMTGTRVFQWLFSKVLFRD
ncbi:MAG TPA: hypothetical protein VGF09_07075 [Solirubrobacterales bacterium]|jgi:hypothetical protein